MKVDVWDLLFVVGVGLVLAGAYLLLGVGLVLVLIGVGIAYTAYLGGMRQVEQERRQVPTQPTPEQLREARAEERRRDREAYQRRGPMVVGPDVNHHPPDCE